MKRFAVLQLSGCAGCEVSLLNADAWVNEYQLAYMPLVTSTYDVPEVDVLLISGGVRSDDDLYKLRRAVKSAKQVVPVGTCAISGGVANLGDRDEVRELFLAEADTSPRPAPAAAFTSRRCVCRGGPLSSRLPADAGALHGRAVGIPKTFKASPRSYVRSAGVKTA